MAVVEEYHEGHEGGHGEHEEFTETTMSSIECLSRGDAKSDLVPWWQIGVVLKHSVM
jgi:hypothetical protein